jgi:hypothetical protein
MGVISTAKVVTGSERAKRPVTLQPGNREWVTAIECINTQGWSLPLVIIFEGKVHQSTWYTDDLPRDWVIAVSENGWTDDILGLTWLKTVFQEHTAHRIKGVYRLLILDGHGSYKTPEFDLFAKEHNIIILCMPPHSSHLLQPLDVSCFAPLKRSYGSVVEQYMRVGVNHVDKVDFLRAYYTARIIAITASTIQSGFAATGIVPYDPDRVLAKLCTQLRTPTPPGDLPQLQGQWIPETPHNVSELELQAKAIKDYIQRRTQSPPSPTDLALNQLVKGCQLAMHNAVILAEENKQLRVENQRQKAKRAQKRTYIATGGVLSVQEGLNRSNTAGKGPVSAVGRVTDQDLGPQTRAPRMCSMCRSLLHTARTCPVRLASN